MLLVEFRGRLVETKRDILDALVKEGQNAEAELADSNVADFERAAERVRHNLKRLNGVFEYKDPLLATQGAVVPYYWLVKSMSEDRLPAVRPFLVAFDEARAENRRIAEDPARQRLVNLDLARYDRLNRSINDAGSLEGRFEILMTFFQRWQRSGSLTG